MVFQQPPGNFLPIRQEMGVQLQQRVPIAAKPTINAIVTNLISPEPAGAQAATAAEMFGQSPSKSNNSTIINLLNSAPAAMNISTVNSFLSPPAYKDITPEGAAADGKTKPGAKVGAVKADTALHQHIKLQTTHPIPSTLVSQLVSPPLSTSVATEEKRTATAVPAIATKRPPQQQLLIASQPCNKISLKQANCTPQKISTKLSFPVTELTGLLTPANQEIHTIAPQTAGQVAFAAQPKQFGNLHQGIQSPPAPLASSPSAQQTTTTLNLQGISLSSLQNAMATIPGTFQNVQIQIPGLAQSLSLPLATAAGATFATATSQATGLLVNTVHSGTLNSIPGSGTQTVVLTNSATDSGTSMLSLPLAHVVTTGLKGINHPNLRSNLAATASTSGQTVTNATPSIQLLSTLMQSGVPLSLAPANATAVKQKPIIISEPQQQQQKQLNSVKKITATPNALHANIQQAGLNAGQLVLPAQNFQLKFHKQTPNTFDAGGSQQIVPKADDQTAQPTFEEIYPNLCFPCAEAPLRFTLHNGECFDISCWWLVTLSFSVTSWQEAVDARIVPRALLSVRVFYDAAQLCREVARSSPAHSGELRVATPLGDRSCSPQSSALHQCVPYRVGREECRQVHQVDSLVRGVRVTIAERREFDRGTSGCGCDCLTLPRSLLRRHTARRTKSGMWAMRKTPSAQACRCVTSAASAALPEPPTHQRAEQMATLIPTTQTTGVEAYEDMFKEITRKLYGEETGHGLHTLGTPMAHVATTGPTLPEGERSFTTLMADRSLTTIEYENNASEANNTFKTEDHITTAFGLAALMQNGFPPPSAISHNFQSSSAASRNGNNFMVNDERWPANAEECLPWNANKSATYNCNQKSAGKHKGGGREFAEAPGDAQTSSGPSGGGQKGQSSVRGGSNSGGAATKRYNCQSCPYSTDRRDLFTRHENIHKDEKPFHCYACLKQFNRADHVKKHFLRMHRELNYDINKTRKSQSGSSAAAGTAKPANYSQPQQQQQQQHISEFLGARSAAAAPEAATNGQGAQEMMPASNESEPVAEKMHISEVHVEKKMSMKSEKVSNSSSLQGAKKKQGDKRYVCCYCPWTGADNWGLKRHLNTHTKPFVCIMCDYKAARSERLATHVFKVHNKKACNKCNFLADDQAQFMTHQTEVHPHDARPARSAGGGSASCTVLRSISNSFVQNTASQLTNNTNSTASGHTFCSLTHNSSVDNCATGSSYSANNNQNLSDLGIQQWRSANRGASNSTNQKKGAERLFQYMEADGSDPEDYSRQLRMAALSRNTASVAQDFHNAGGGDKLIVPPSLAILGSLMEQLMQQQARWEESNGDESEESHDQACDSSAAMSNSPPAINHYQQSNGKKNRRRSCHDKENTNAIPHKCDKWDERMWMKEIIGMYQAHLSAMRSRQAAAAEKRHRKQLQPRKIPQRETSNIVRIRDKHLTRLVSRQKSCQICVYRHKCVVMPFHSKASLILHTLWRHSHRRFACSMCQESFAKRYKLMLHQQIAHKRRTFKLRKHSNRDT
ncbi:uncharacterized protein LOC132256023 [Phlebotomus argentipes]|uniref:uncharacterized protein LOC132256023 n=1 Tax=Phlebotomus argentipes TaxID=94469 RepID=UPI0028931F12|nr:uncharacterized protein LOC132256023 [Phlebotomus argentipes]